MLRQDKICASLNHQKGYYRTTMNAKSHLEEGVSITLKSFHKSDEIHVQLAIGIDLPPRDYSAHP